MPRNEYQAQLEKLRTDVRSMADLVLERYEQALTVFETGETAVAEGIIKGDREINRLYLDLEGDCIRLLALQQPVAGDLRFIASSFKIVTDLERIGDLTTNLAAYAMEGTDEPAPDVDLQELGTFAQAMVADAMVAYENENAEKTWEIAARDDDLDARCKAASEQVVRRLLDHDLGGEATEAVLDDASRDLLTIRDVERVGDHAVNICARTLYMIENDEGLIY